jgi:hypothetical membrane protein
MDKILDFLYTKKMWVSGILTALFGYGDLIRTILADENVSFVEAETAVRALVTLVGTLAVMVGVYKAENAPAPTTSAPFSEEMPR